MRLKDVLDIIEINYIAGNKVIIKDILGHTFTSFKPLDQPDYTLEEAMWGIETALKSMFLLNDIKRVDTIYFEDCTVSDNNKIIVCIKERSLC